MIDDKTKAFLATNIKGLIQDFAEWMEERNAVLRADSEFSATPAEAKLFATLRGRERSISELARVLGVSRQAVHHTVHRLIEENVVELISAPDNKRDKLVRITKRGQDVQRMAARNLNTIEEELARSIGPDEVERLREILLTHLRNVAEDKRDAE